jgi:hypothetical protein
MHIHSDKLTTHDLIDALDETGLTGRGVDLDPERFGIHGSRKRARRLDAYLVAQDGHGRRYGNTGTRGAGYDKAALYDEWGAFIAALFMRDPDALIGPYTADDFIDKATDWRPRGTGETPSSITDYANLYR